MLKAQASKWCPVDPLRKKFTADEKKAWSKAERAMYKSAYELGGEARATAVLRRYLAEQAAAAAGAGAPAADAGAPAAADEGAAPTTRKAAAEPAAPSAAASAPPPAAVAAVASIAPVELSARPVGAILLAGSAAWEDVGKRTLSAEEAMVLPSFHRLLPSLRVALVVAGPSACHLFALTADGVTYGWGRNASGQLGLGHTEPVASPVVLEWLGGARAPDADRIVAAACGKAHSLLVTRGGKLWACGSNSFAQLGTGAAAKLGSVVSTPKAVRLPSGGEGACRVAAGADFSLATDARGRLYSWGHPQCGQLGHGSTGEFLERAGKVDYEFRTEPALVSLTTQGGAQLPPLGPIACGDRHSVAVTTAGDVYTWGFGGYGRLGHAEQSDKLRPALVAFSHKAKIVEVFAGGTCSYALSTTGSTLFWGRTKSTGEATMYPKAVADLHGWHVRALGCGHTSTVVAAEGALISWGPSPCYGELGYGADGPKSSTTPKLVDALAGCAVSHVACGYACSALVVPVDGAEHAASRAVVERCPAYADVLGEAGKAAVVAGADRKQAAKAARAARDAARDDDDDDDDDDGGGGGSASGDDANSDGYSGSDGEEEEERAKPAGKKRAPPAAKSKAKAKRK